MHGLFAWAGACFAEERDRWILWTPVGLALGIGGYFLGPQEPPFWAGGLALTMAVTGAGVLRRASGSVPFIAARRICVMTAIVAAGFCAAQVRTHMVQAPVLAKALTSTGFSGRILQIEYYPDGQRVTLGQVHLSRLENHLLPAKIRLRLRGRQPELEPGDWISGRAGLSPPGAPVLPGGFDFQRHAYFQQIGGFGFAYGPVKVEARAGDMSPLSFNLWLARFRKLLSARILDGLEAPYGGIAAALMTGEKHAVSDEILENLRNSGLAHLLAISGLHIGLIAGIVFTGVRMALVCVPGLALRAPVKKWAAFAAIVGAFFYALISGATLPTQRAFLMAAIALVGVMLDRRGLSLRAVAFAAVVVLLIQPESLLGPSFQMSFAAVAALVASYEGWSAYRLKRLKTNAETTATWPFRKLLRYLGGIGLTTVIASAATAPFALYHFHQFAEYSLFANLLAVPLTALWVMPWAVLSFAAMPFGLEAWMLAPMGWGLSGVVSIAETVAHWPGAVTRLPAMPLWTIAVLTLAGTWLVIWRHRWRFLAIPCLFGAIISLYFVPTPDIAIDGGGRFFCAQVARWRICLFRYQLRRPRPGTVAASSGGG